MRGGTSTRIRTVTMNAAPRMRATSRKRVLSMGKFMPPECENNNSEVISRIIAVIAIQRLMSDRERGNCTGLTLYNLISYFNDF